MRLRTGEGVVNRYKFFIGKRLFRRCFSAYASEKLCGTVLDVGSGHGPLKELLHCKRYISLEYQLHLRPSVVGSALAIPFKDGSFDGVICTEVLEHLPEPEGCIREVKRILRRGGLLYMTAPMLWPLHYEPHDYFRFTKYGLLYLLEKNDFGVLELQAIGGLFSFVSMRFCEKLYNLLNKLPFFLPKEVRFVWTVPVILPVSWFLYFLSLLLDPLFKRDVFAWCVLAQCWKKMDGP